jgi:Cu(I)/Ag(I) efflux system membrane fusion protein
MRKITTIILLIIALTANYALAEGTKYTCPMHPHYIAEEPGSCPICGMDLVPVSQEEQEDKISEGNGKGVITIAPETIQNIGVRTEKAEAARFGVDVRSYGAVTENVRIQHDVSSRVAGWIEALNVTAVGDEIKKGELLFTLYSPDLISAQQDYIAAIISGVKGRIASSAKRLKSLGIQEQTLEQIKNKRRKLQNIPFYSEVDGIVSKLNIRQGTYVKSGMQLALIQDYSSVWINVSVAEKDLEFLSKGMKAEVTLPNLSSQVLTARIDYIYPTIDQTSRTGQVRLVLNNEDGSLRPGAYADVNFETTFEKRLAIPSEAVLRSSEGNYVVVALGAGRFQSRAIKTGIHNKGKVQILSGLNEGDEIVVSSQFLIDSESSLREAFRKMQKMQTPLALLEVNENQLAMINHLIDSAIYIQEILVGEEELQASMLMPALKLNDHLLPKFRGTKLQYVLEGAESAIMEARQSRTDSELRIALANLMRALKAWILEGKPQYYKEKDLKLFMDHNTGDLWLQLDAQPANPYGDGHPMLQPWPDKVDVEMPDVQAVPAGGAHAGH